MSLIIRHTTALLALAGNSATAEDTCGNPEAIVPKTGSIQADSASFQYTFPAYSVNVLRRKK